MYVLVYFEFREISYVVRFGLCDCKVYWIVSGFIDGFDDVVVFDV